MEIEKKYIRKSFWIHQYEEEENFLEKMRCKGWRFVKLYRGIPTKYEFEKCQPEEYSYQLDFVKEDEDTQDYHTLFKDAGWKEIFSWQGFGGKWYYFSKRKVNGKREKIFTDQESRLNLIDKLILSYAGFLLLMFMAEINGIRSSVEIINNITNFKIMVVLFDVLMALFAGFIIYLEVSMLLVRRRIKKENEERI